MSVRKGQLIIYSILFAISIILPKYCSICLLLLIVLNFFFIVSKTSIEFSVLTTMLMGSEAFMIINAFVCLLGLLLIRRISIKIYKKGIRKENGLLVIIIVLNSLVNGIINNTVINVIVYIGYLLFLWLCYCGFKGVLDISKVFDSMRLIIVMEFISTIIRVIMVRSVKPGDYFAGTINNAHFFGNWLALTMILITTMYKDCVHTYYSYAKYATLMGLCLIMLYLADAKGIILSFFIALVLYFIVKILSKKNVLFWAIVGMYVLFAIVMYVFSIPYIKTYLQSKLPVYSVYLYTEGWNGRYQYSYGTLFDSLANIRALFGYGLGQYGSRISNAFAYNIMWRNDSFINNLIVSIFSPHYVDNYSRYVSYYTQDLVDQIAWRSAVLTYPFSSFLSLLSETGIIGVLFFAKILNREFMKSKNKFMVIYFLAICIFDLYFDDFPCAIAIIIYLIIGKQVVSVYSGLKNPVYNNRLAER